MLSRSPALQWFSSIQPHAAVWFAEKEGCSRRGSRNLPIHSSKDQISQTAHLVLQSCLLLIWSSDPDCVSHRTCGYRTRKPPLHLAERRQGALHCNGFRVSSPMLQCGLRKRRGALGVVLGTSQYIVRRIEIPSIPLHEVALQKLQIRDLFDLPSLFVAAILLCGYYEFTGCRAS